jgi:hypothetical protein
MNKTEEIAKPPETQGGFLSSITPKNEQRDTTIINIISVTILNIQDNNFRIGHSLFDFLLPFIFFS